MTGHAARGLAGPPRTALAWAFAAVAVAGGVLLVRLAGGQDAILRVDAIAAGPTGSLAALGNLLPFGYAFAAGMLASVNPCGLALLPGYLALYVGGRHQAGPARARLGHALLVATTISLVVVAVFALAGAVVGAAGSALGSALPVIGVAVGLVLAALGAHLLAGGVVYSPLGDRAAARLAPAAGSRSLGAFAAYGLAYAAASLGCALPIFLTVVGVASAARDPLQSLAQLGVYGLGMASVLAALTLATALLKTVPLRLVRGASGRFLHPLTGLILVLVGAYVAVYWITLGF